MEENCYYGRLTFLTIPAILSLVRDQEIPPPEYQQIFTIAKGLSMIRILVLAFCLFFPLEVLADIVVRDAGFSGVAAAPAVNNNARAPSRYSFISAPALTESRAERISLLESFKSNQPLSAGALLGSLINNDDEPVRYDDGGVVYEEPKSSIGNGTPGASPGISAIPEPGSLTLAVCLASLGLAGRRRR